MKKKPFSDPFGQSQRQLRVGELIRRTLSQILIRGELHDPELQRLSINVTQVAVSADLSIATVYIIPLGGSTHYEPAIALLAQNKNEMRRLIGRAVKLKVTPDLRFRIDETFDRMEQMEKLLERPEVKRDLGRES